MPVNFKMNRALTDATIARLGITKIKLEYRIALNAFQGNFKIKQAVKVVSIVRVVVNLNVMLALLWVFLLQIVWPVTKASTNRRTDPRSVFHV